MYKSKFALKISALALLGALITQSSNYAARNYPKKHALPDAQIIQRYNFNKNSLLEGSELEALITDNYIVPRNSR